MQISQIKILCYIFTPYTIPPKNAMESRKYICLALLDVTRIQQHNNFRRTEILKISNTMKMSERS